MVTTLEIILEIIKVTVPALIVFLTVFYMFKTYTENEQRNRIMEQRKDNKSMSFPFKMQAYERLALFCERISLSNLMLRVRDEKMNAADFRLALMVAIQQEYEHNISQQVYVSEELWKIIMFAKNDTINIIDLVSQTVPNDGTSLDLSRAIFNYLNEVKNTSLDKARSAISQEASTFL